MVRRAVATRRGRAWVQRLLEPQELPLGEAAYVVVGCPEGVLCRVGVAAVDAPGRGARAECGERDGLLAGQPGAEQGVLGKQHERAGDRPAFVPPPEESAVARRVEGRPVVGLGQ